MRDIMPKLLVQNTILNSLFFFIFENLLDLYWEEVNNVINWILQSFKHPRVKYTVANWMLVGLIKYFSFIKCLSMEIRIVLEYMYVVILFPLAIVTWCTSSFFWKSSKIKSIQWAVHGFQYKYILFFINKCPPIL